MWTSKPYVHADHPERIRVWLREDAKSEVLAKAEASWPLASAGAQDARFRARGLRDRGHGEAGHRVRGRSGSRRMTLQRRVLHSRAS